MRRSGRGDVVKLKKPLCLDVVDVFFLLGLVAGAFDSHYPIRWYPWLFIAQFVAIAVLYALCRSMPSLVIRRIVGVVLVVVACSALPFTRSGGAVLLMACTASGMSVFPSLVGWLALVGEIVWQAWILADGGRGFSVQSYNFLMLFALAGASILLLSRSNQTLARQKTALQQQNLRIENLALAKERARMAADMHDSFGQQLSGIHMLLQAVQSGARPGDGDAIRRAAEHAAKADDEVMMMLREARQMARALDPSVFGVRFSDESIRDFAKSFHSTGLNVDVVIVGTVDNLPEDVALLMYRAMQESLMNVVRHAHASKARICLDVGMRYASMTVEDDGIGFERERDGSDSVSTVSSRQLGFGLAALSSRARELGGDCLFARPEALGGAKVALNLPLRESLVSEEMSA